jgi:hypothetical protein
LLSHHRGSRTGHENSNQPKYASVRVFPCRFRSMLCGRRLLQTDCSAAVCVEPRTNDLQETSAGPQL